MDNTSSHLNVYLNVICCSLAEARAQLHEHRTVHDDFEELEAGNIKRQVSLLAESDARYAGRRVSRKDIEEQISAAGVSFITWCSNEFYLNVLSMLNSVRISSWKM